MMRVNEKMMERKKIKEKIRAKKPGINM